MVNTAQITNIRNKVTALINKYGNTAVISTLGTPTKDAWGAITYSGVTSTTTVGVTDTYMIARMQLVSAGRLKDGQMLMLLKGTETIDYNYTITTGGETFNVVEIEKYKAADIVVAYAVTLGRAS